MLLISEDLAKMLSRLFDIHNPIPVPVFAPHHFGQPRSHHTSVLTPMTALLQLYRLAAMSDDAHRCDEERSTTHERLD